VICLDDLLGVLVPERDVLDVVMSEERDHFHEPIADGPLTEVLLLHVDDEVSQVLDTDIPELGRLARRLELIQGVGIPIGCLGRLQDFDVVQVLLDGV
jgi:hypothetical protein